jgi:hypothetical protein
MVDLVQGLQDRMIGFIKRLIEEPNDPEIVASVLLEQAVELYERVHGYDEAAQAVARVWAQTPEELRLSIPSASLH